MAKASDRTPVTLCCAQEDASHLRPLVSHLEQQDGFKVRLIEGVEDDPYLLGSALDRQLGACVIVACLSDALGPTQLRRIEGVYNARKGPSHWLDTIFFEPDETLAMAESVRAVVAKADAKRAAIDRIRSQPQSPGESARMRASESGHMRVGESGRMRDVVGMTKLSAVGTDAIPSPNPAIGEASRQAEGLAGGKPSPVTPAEEPSDQASESGSDSTFASESASASASVSMTAPAAAPSTSEGGDPSASQTFQSSQFMQMETGSKNPSWIAPVLFLIFLAVAGTVVLLLLQQNNGDSWIGHRGAPTLEGAEQEAEGSAPSESPADPDTGSEANATETGPSETSGAGETSGPSETSDAAEPSPANEAALIVEAIEAGEMRAVDLILIAKSTELSPWRSAADLCRTKALHGVRGWRLPSLDELKTIRKARMVERDRYWSSTLAPNEGSGSDHVFVLDLAERSIDPVLKDATDVRALCVRGALSAGQ